MGGHRGAAAVLFHRPGEFLTHSLHGGENPKKK